ncbi:MAG: sulfatase-like hydrolase/transferase [Thermoanaerobaculales bacterium]|nr:sulfatase-like hydrolase/transferase [Thermoanaerobaculales bacterium]
MGIKRSAAWAVLLVGIAITAWAVWNSLPKSTRAAVRVRPSPGANVLLVTLDTTRADHLGCYGGDAEATPTLDSLAAAGVLFEQALATAPITLPSHTSMLTGMSPLQHGVRNNGMFTLPESVETLADTLSAEGYDTAAFVSASVLARRYGLGRSFDHYDDDLSQGRHHGQRMVPERPGDVTLAAALEWFESRAENTPFFCWFHLYDPHQAYDPPPEYRRRFANDPYTAEIAFADAVVGQLLAYLEEHHLLTDTIISVVGDHGEGLGEHGEATHAILLHQATLRVPWILTGPRLPNGVRISTPVGGADVAPTLATLVGVRPPNAGSGDGRSLLPVLRGNTEGFEDRPLYSETLLPHFQYGWSPLQAVRRGPWELVEGRRHELFNLERDPRELVDLADRQSREADDLLDTLGRINAEVEEPESEKDARIEMSRSERENLEALGYLGTETPPRSDPPDPRDLVGAHRHMERARQLGSAGQLVEAVREIDAMLELDPDNSSALMTRADFLMQDGRFDEAESTLERFLVVDPSNANAYAMMARLELQRGNPERALLVARTGKDARGAFNTLKVLEAHALTALGKRPEAEDLLDRALVEAPEDADLLTSRAGLYSSRGEFDRAEEMLRQAVAIDAFHLQARLRLTELLETSGRLEDAAEVLEELLKANPGQPDALAALGRVRLVDPQAARPYLEEAVRLNPGRFDPLFNLGLCLLQLGQPEKGEASLRRALDLRPGHPLCRNNLAIALTMQGRLAEAETDLRALIAEKPDFVDAYNNLALVLARAGRGAEAEETVRRALELEPRRVDASLTLAEILHNQERYAEAVDILAPLAEAASSPEFDARYGMALEAAGDHAKAQPLLRRALTVYSSELDLVLAAARCEEAIGETGSAMALYERAAQMAPPGRNRDEALAGVDRLALKR